jgi:hypothetical protein
MGDEVMGGVAIATLHNPPSATPEPKSITDRILIGVNMMSLRTVDPKPTQSPPFAKKAKSKRGSTSRILPGSEEMVSQKGDRECLNDWIDAS